MRKDLSCGEVKNFLVVLTILAMLRSIEKFQKNLSRWYFDSRRDLPWRVTRGRPDPYRVLVSEAMLQQTQVVTVVPYFLRFLELFPTIQTLAAADEMEVLRVWQGLGYYSRARNLLAAARRICSEYGGVVPRDIGQLLRLPGVGRYTAGAIASLAYDRRAAILDGNVARVLCRIDAIRSDPREAAIRERLWQRAEEILPQSRCGDFNSALMELGATICTPRSPRCSQCAVRQSCEALACGVAQKIPPPRKTIATPLLRRHVYCIQHRRRWLIEQRPARGRWAGMWQFVTVPRGRRPQIRIEEPRKIGATHHALSHRRYRFEVFACAVSSIKPGPWAGLSSRGESRPRAWVPLSELHKYPLPRPHLTIAQMLAELPK